MTTCSRQRILSVARRASKSMKLTWDKFNDTSSRNTLLSAHQIFQIRFLISWIKCFSVQLAEAVRVDFVSERSVRRSTHWNSLFGHNHNNEAKTCEGWRPYAMRCAIAANTNTFTISWIKSIIMIIIKWEYIRKSILFLIIIVWFQLALYVYFASEFSLRFCGADFRSFSELLQINENTG